MNIQKKREEVIDLIEQLKDQSDRLKKDEKANLLELSELMETVKQLHENVVILNYMSIFDQNEDQEDSIEEQAEMDIRSVEESFMEDDSNEDEEEINADVQDDDTLSIAPEEEEQDSSETVNDHSEIDANEVEDIEVEDNTTEEMRGDLSLEDIEESVGFSDKPDINEVYTEQEDSSVSARLEKHPINDMLAAIGLNERYLYANELFEGDISMFKQSIQKLDGMSTYEEAENYFSNDLKMRYEWSDDNELVQALSLLIERRYM